MTNAAAAPGRRRRRRRVRGSLVFAGCFLTLLTILAAVAERWWERQPFLPGSLRPALGQAAAHLYRHDAERSRRLTDLVTAAERSGEAQVQAPFWQRDPDAVAAAWDQALAAAVRELTESFRHRQEGEASWLEKQAAATVSLERASVEVDALTLGPTAVKRLAEARLHLETARRDAARGAYSEASRGADLALEAAEAVHRRWQSLHQRFDQPQELRLWNRWLDESVEESRRRGITVLVVDKVAHRLDVYTRGRRVTSFPVELGVRGLTRKLYSGDRATPEGRYRVSEVRGIGQTRFYKALMLDYPNAEDRKRHAEARRRGTVPAGVGIGGLIEIHGDGGRGRDWTDGCIALTNEDMDRLFRHVKKGTPVTIVGSLGEHPALSTAR